MGSVQVTEGCDCNDLRCVKNALHSEHQNCLRRMLQSELSVQFGGRTGSWLTMDGVIIILTSDTATQSFSRQHTSVTHSHMNSKGQVGIVRP